MWMYVIEIGEIFNYIEDMLRPIYSCGCQFYDSDVFNGNKRECTYKILKMLKK